MGKASKASQTKLTTGQAARILEVSPNFVRWLVEHDRLACEETPLGRLYDPGEVERLRQERAAA